MSTPPMSLSMSSPLAQVGGEKQVEGNAVDVVQEVEAEEAVVIGEDAGEPNLLDFGEPDGDEDGGGGEDVYSLLSSLDFFSGGTTTTTNNPFV